MSTADSQYVIRNTLQPDDVGAIVALHGKIYSREQGWDLRFDAHVAGPLEKFALSQSSREKIWIVECDSQVAGSIAIVDSGNSIALLRWFILVPELRGRGLGRRLLHEAIAFAKESKYERIELWTVAELQQAGRLYRANGFELAMEQTHSDWGKPVTEQKLVLQL